MDNSLTVIDSVDLNGAVQTIQKISAFQAVINASLKEKQDYGVIPGTAKPTLLKPGAEKVLMLMGLTSEYDVTERLQDYDSGFFAFTVKCVLTKNGTKITEGLGHCNTKEAKYAYRWVYEKEVPADMDKAMLVKKQYEGKYGAYFKYRIDNDDPYTIANTCLKMAKKRAQIDAVLTVASLSEIFTQDVEDLKDILGGDIEKPTEMKAKRQQPGETSADGLIDPDTGEVLDRKPTAKMGVANDPVLNFGKYSGKSISEIAQTDEGYIKWLADKAKDADVREAAKNVMNADEEYDKHFDEHPNFPPFNEDMPPFPNDDDLPF